MVKDGAIVIDVGITRWKITPKERYVIKGTCIMILCQNAAILRLFPAAWAP